MHPKAARLRQRARQHRFRALVRQALDELPVPVRIMLDNVAVVVEDEPETARLDAGTLSAGSELFGLYQGIPVSQRNSGYSLVTPDRITVFQGPIERAYRTRGEMRDQVRVTVLHELAHHLGFDEDQMDRLGLA